MKQHFDTFTSFVSFIAFVVMISSFISVPLLVGHVFTTGSLMKSIGMASMWTVVLPGVVMIVTRAINEVIFGNQD